MTKIKKKNVVHLAICLLPLIFRLIIVEKNINNNMFIHCSTLYQVKDGEFLGEFSCEDTSNLYRASQTPR